MKKYFISLLTIIVSQIGYCGEQVAAEPLSKCLESMKSLSTKMGWGYSTEGKTFFLPPNYTIDYTYDQKTKRHSPVVMEFKGEKLAVSTQSGTTIIEGKSCNHDSKTSVGIITELILKSEKSFEEFKKVDPKSVGKMSPEAEKNYKDGSKKVENEYKQILTDCSNENLGSISESAKLMLDNLFGNRGAKNTSEVSQGSR